MGVATGFSNSWTSGEIFEDATDRVDIAPIHKGCSQALNLIVQTTGPLKKRRGFWYLGDVADSTKLGRLIPFRRSITDALMLEFGDLTCRVWQANGAPLISGGVQVQFATPYASATVPKLRFKQVADVIYFTTSDGAQPRALARLTDISWSFALLAFPNGPWLSENLDAANTVTLGAAATTTDATTTVSPAGQSVAVGVAGVTLAFATYTGAFAVGDQIRVRQSTGNPGAMSWSPGANTPPGCFRVSVGNVYRSTYDASQALSNDALKANATTPPVQTSGSQSDGCSTFSYLHDGAGILQVTAIGGLAAKVTAALPIGGAAVTSYWARGAYGPTAGWPRAWPSAVEERLVMAATGSNLDFLDMSRTAGFTPTSVDFHPGQGTGNVIATDAIRRRLGDDGGEILWTRQSTFLIAGSASAEYVVGSGLFGEPITPSTVIIRKISDFGSADVYPATLEKGLAYVTRGGQTLRTIRLDLQQNDTGGDASFLAHHIETRLFTQLSWIPAPDRVLWTRLGDGGLASLTVHDEQQVRGWTTQALSLAGAGPLTVEDIVSLPGPGKFETLWMIASGTVGGAFRRMLLMHSQVSDGLFMDCASLYSGAPVSAIGGLGYLAGETVRVLANGVQLVDQLVSLAGSIVVPAGTVKALVGLPYKTRFRSLKLSPGDMLARQRLAGATVDLLGTVATVSVEGGGGEITSSRLAGDALAGPVARRFVDRVNVLGDVSTDPRLVITEDTAYDFGIFALRPNVQGGAS